MTPAGYLAKSVYRRPEWLKAPQVVDIYSVSGCISEDFADYVSYWKHNGYWFFDSPEIIRTLAKESSIQLEGTSLFYYEVYEKEFDGEGWNPYTPEQSRPTHVRLPSRKQFEGFDVVAFYARSSPECSPLSCNSMAEELHTNAHCLFESFDEAKRTLDNGSFKNAEPGPYRIFSVYSVDWA
jgi:hypothetical protein